MKKVKVLNTYRANKKTMAVSLCPTCNNQYETRLDHLTAKNFETECKSCSCKKKNKKHSGCNEKLYSVWKSMNFRCSNPKNKGYKNYGGRGITVCDEWIKSYINFKEWALKAKYRENLSIDRINNDKGYSPENCRWASRETQSQNQRVLRSTNSSGYRGVSFNKTAKKFMGEIMVSGKKHYLGLFENACDAAKAYDLYVIEHQLKHTKNGVI